MNEPPYNWRRQAARASELIQDPAALKKLAGSGARKFDALAAGSERLRRVADDLSTLFALLRAYARGEYRRLSTQSLLSVAAAVLYFVTPLDAIPDFLLGVGLIDDVAIIGFVLKQFETELEAFRAWQTAEPSFPKDP